MENKITEEILFVLHGNLKDLTNVTLTLVFRQKARNRLGNQTFLQDQLKVKVNRIQRTEKQKEKKKEKGKRKTRQKSGWSQLISKIRCAIG